LGYNLYSGYEQKQQLNAVASQEAGNAASLAATAATETNAAKPLLTSGETLQNYLTTGTLPPEFQATVTEQLNAAKASIIQGYASRGMSTDPQQNSALAQDLANAGTQAEALKANLESTLATAGQQMVQQATSLLQAGASATEISSQIPILVQQLNSQLNTQTAQAISSFAASLGGQNKGVTLNLATAVNPSGTLNLG
jgi:hypothetical protein